MEDKEQVIAQITAAFAAVKYPGDCSLRGSDLGTEPELLEKEFKGKDDWRVLEAKFLDQAPSGFGSALSFFSDKAFHFYLPAYMIADIRSLLNRSSPVFHLTHGLECASRKEPINPLIHGSETWSDQRCRKFAMFNADESAAIVAYLALIKKLRAFKPEWKAINEALNFYWRKRAKGETFKIKPRTKPAVPLVTRLTWPNKSKR